MYTFLFMAHSGWRWIVLALVIITLIKMLVGWLGKQNFTRLDAQLLLYTRIGIYVQIVLGIILWIIRQGWLDMRLTGEHVIVALLAVGGIEFGAARAKKVAGDTNKFKFATIGFAIAFVLIYVALRAVGGMFV